MSRQIEREPRPLGSDAVFLRQILDMQPYSPPLEGRTEAEDIDLLDFNERLEPAHPLVREALRDELRRNRLHVYPEYGDLDNIIANYTGVKPDQVIATNGADQAIDIVYRALVGNEDNVLLPTPTFAMLEQSAHIQGARLISPRYKGPKLEYPFEEVIERIKQGGIRLVVLCNPNNPTGTPIPKEQSEKIIEEAATVGANVMVDEAYHEFAPDLTVADLVDKYSNLFIIRSNSKTLGIARLRAGYVVSQAKNIAELRKVRGPYDVNGFAVAAMKTLRFPEVREDLQHYVHEVMQESKPEVEKFYRDNGINFFPSEAGFHLLEEPGLYDYLRNRDGHRILVRPRSDPPGTVRVTIGTGDVTKRYLEALERYLQATR